jgi:ATP-dependent Lhr-like helicase
LALVDQGAVDGLKFSAALPMDMAVATLAARQSDVDHAREVIGEGLVIRS